MAPAFASRCALVLGIIVLICTESCVAFRIRDTHPTPVGPVSIPGNQGNVKLSEANARPKKGVFGRASTRGSFVANDSSEEDSFGRDLDSFTIVTYLFWICSVWSEAKFDNLDIYFFY